MNEEDLIFKKEGSIAYITIHREKALNALNSAVLQRLEEILSELEEDSGVVVAVITGTGQKAFVAGADIKAIKEALHYGLYDLGRLERLVLSHVAGDFFNIDENEES